MTIFTTSRTAGWLSAADCSVDAFTSLLSQRTDLADYPCADAVERDVLIYGEKLRDAVGSAGSLKGDTAVPGSACNAFWTWWGACSNVSIPLSGSFVNSSGASFVPRTGTR